MKKYFEVKAIYPDNALVTEQFDTVTAARKYMQLIRNDVRKVWIKETCRHLTPLERCEMKVRIIVQRFINNVRSMKYSYITLADEYFEIIQYCRQVYGICPNDCGEMYDRLPKAMQDEICRQWEIAVEGGERA